MPAPLTMPVIDLAVARSPERTDRIRLAREVRTACSASGVFYIANPVVPPGLVASHFALAREFFALDVAEKCEIAVTRSNCFRGYEPLGTQSSDVDAPADFKEGFIMGPDLAPDHPHVVAHYPNTGANLWPRRPAGMREHMDAYVVAMNELARQIAAQLALSLDLPAGYFSEALREPMTYSQLFHYPSLPVAPLGNRRGAGAHVDWGMLTILLQDDVGGLEIRAPDGTWHTAAPIPETFVVILGEMMLRFTNGLYRSATHRVAENVSGRSRYSMPTFVDPDYDYCIACVPTCRPHAGEPQFPACSVSTHMRAMAIRPLSAANSSAPVSP